MLEGEGRLAVIIPTMQAVERVETLTSYLRSACPWQIEFVVVDNGPRATKSLWGEQFETLVIEPGFLGSEQAFMAGLRAAGGADRYLLLDHDASISDESLAALLACGARFPDAVIAGSHGYDHAGWRPVEPAAGPDHPSGLVSLRAAQWSGFLLNSRARDLLLAREPSGLWFSWDDWLATWFLRSKGLEVLGTPDAVIWNHRTDLNSPWKLYYDVRNELLFARDTGVTPRVFLRTCATSGRKILSAAKRRQLKMFLAACRGMFDGVIGRRGMIMTPAPN